MKIRVIRVANMVLSDVDIKKRIKSGSIVLKPVPNLDEALGTVSLDLRLGHQFRVYRRTARPYIDVRDTSTFENLTEEVEKEDKAAFVIHPGEFVLASTFEHLELPNDLAGRLEGKSSLGRLGIVVHSTAGKIDPGFKGQLVLEITNIGTLPILLYPEMRVCQVLFEELSSPTSKTYSERESSKYKNQIGAQASILSNL